MGESVSLTAIPSAGFDFTGWTGSVSSSDNPLSLTMDADKVETAAFQRYDVSQCNQLVPGASINAKIKELSALPGSSAICPAEGKYVGDEGALDVQGKGTVQIKGI